MGGIGSGSYERKHTKAMVGSEDRVLDIRRWQREGVMKPGWRFDWIWSQNDPAAGVAVRVEEHQIVLTYRCEWRNGLQVHREYSVILDWTPCPFGGGRYWFRCPTVHCGQRVAILYLDGEAQFTCRHCQALAYASQREDRIDRNLRRTRKIKRKLGGREGSINSSPDKPKRMRWRTYERLTSEVNAAMFRAMLAVLDKVGG
jgi:hypothetical protein